MTKEKIKFAQKADKFVVHYGNNGMKEFDNYKDAAAFYNECARKGYAEFSAVCGLVGMTLAYHIGN